MTVRMTRCVNLRGVQSLLLTRESDARSASYLEVCFTLLALLHYVTNDAVIVSLMAEICWNLLAPIIFHHTPVLGLDLTNIYRYHFVLPLYHY